MILKTQNENVQKGLVGISWNSWNFVCKSEIGFWCTCDQKILKTFKYLKVWIKNGIKVTFPSKSDSEDLEWEFQ